MKKKFPKQWSLAFAGFIGMFFKGLFETIRYFVNGEFNIGGIIGSFIASTIAIVVNLIYVRRKKDNTPEIDERTRKNVFKYIAYASQIIFLILMVILSVLSFMEIESVSTISLWIVIWLNMLIIGVGSMIVMRR